MFLGNAQIPLIDWENFNFFKEGYTGGAVDVYKPYGENIYRYDVNSLYPHIMDSTPMPVGTPTYFEGDILSMVKLDQIPNSLEPAVVNDNDLRSQATDLNNKPFGIFEVEVTAPENLKTPILQLRVKTQRGGTRTIAPIGN
jgi:hypothetical protein